MTRYLNSVSVCVVTLAAVAAVMLAPALAQAKDLQAGGSSFKVKQAKLALGSPIKKSCPSETALVARFVTNQPGSVTFRYRKAGGGKSGYITVETFKGATGLNIAKHVQPLAVSKSTDTKYMVEVKGHPKVSGWVPVQAQCGLAVLADPAIAQPKNILKAQMGIKGPKTNLCPNEAIVQVWVFTDFEGPVPVMIARKGMGAGQPIVLQAKKAGNGKYMATYKKTFPITSSIDTQYRVLVGGGQGVASNWVPLKASCKIAGGPGNLQLGG